MLENLQLMSFFLPLSLGLSVISNWFSRQYALPLCFLIIAVALSYVLGFVDGRGIVAILAGGVLIYTYYSTYNPLLKFILGGIVTVFTLLMYAHLIPGFHNSLIIKDLIFSSDSMPYRFYLNLDKISLGVFFLAFGIPLSRTIKEWAQGFSAALVPLGIAIGILWVLSIIFNYVRFDFKIPSITLAWCVFNLLFVAVIEEAFFRGFLQNQLSLALKKVPQGSTVALSLAAILFGLGHYRGGPVYIGLSMIAGVIYGYAYKRNHRLESAILTHFGLNLVHFLFFSYPALIRS